MSNDVRDYKKFKGGIRLSKRTTDPTGNLEEGVIVYNSTEKSLKVHNGSGFAAVGGGAGGSLDTFHTEDLTTLQTSSINETSGKYSLEILNAGISKKTLKVTIDNSCTTGDKIVFPVIDLNERQKGQTCSISFYYKTEDEGGGTPYDEKIDVIVATDSGFTNTILVSSLEDSSSIKKFVDTFTIPSGTTNLYYGFKCNATLPNGVFYIDDIEFSQDPFVQANLGSTNPHIITPAKSNLTNWVSYTPATTTTDDGTGQATSGKWRRVGDSMEVVFEVLFGTGGNPGGNHAIVGLPTSVATSPWKNDYEIDNALVPHKQRIVGEFWIAQGTDADLNMVSDQAGNSNRSQAIIFNDNYPGFVNLTDSSQTGTDLELGSWDAFGPIGAGDKIYGKFTVPIKEWSAQDSNWLAALPMTKWKKKSLSSTFTTNGTMSDLTFSGLSSGIYRLSGKLRIIEGDASSDTAQVTVKLDTTNLFNLVAYLQPNADLGSFPSSFTYIFEVTGSNSSITFVTSDFDGGGNDRVIGGTSPDSSFAILEKLPMHEDAGTIWD